MGNNWKDRLQYADTIHTKQNANYILKSLKNIISYHGIGKLNKFSKMPRNVMSRALYKVAQNTATPISVTNVAMSDPNGVRPRQSRHTVIEYRIKLEISVRIFRNELGLRIKLQDPTKKYTQQIDKNILPPP